MSLILLRRSFLKNHENTSKISQGTTILPSATNLREMHSLIHRRGSPSTPLALPIGFKKTSTPSIFQKLHFSTSSPSTETSSSSILMGNQMKWKRTHRCGEVTEALEGSTVVVCGWLSSLRTLGSLNFIALRDGTGVVQCCIEEKNLSQLSIDLSSLTLESILSIQGVVKKRPAGDENLEMSTGKVEVTISAVQLLNPSLIPPFDIRSDHLANEELRLKYRYLDLRRPSMHSNLLKRSQVFQIVRSHLIARHFTEVETPLLFKGTVESGAKEFIVPSRQLGKFYALPQSPQQYKQLLIASGIDRYFQVAKCFRDEGAKSDRQPEFTQLDMEMAFITPEDIQEVIETLVVRIWKEILGVEIPRPFQRMSYKEAVTVYGSDKPDLRYDLKIASLSEAVAGSDVGVFSQALSQNHGVWGFNAKGLGSLSGKELEELQEEAEKAGGKVLPIRIVDGKWKSPISKHLHLTTQKNLEKILNASEGDLLLISTGKGEAPNLLLGRLRTYCATLLIRKGLLTLPPASFRFLWVVDFPLFSKEPDLVSTHHPFTAPFPEDAHLLDSNHEDDLLQIRGQHYDIVVNGVEMGGGSIRIHNAEYQEKVFHKLSFSTFQTNQFKHLLEALRHGCPPHGGIALGFDRMMAILCNSASIREVIAFPKTASGNELMTNSPSPVSEEELKEFGLVLEKKQ